MGVMPRTGIYEDLRRAIQEAGYYPALVLDALGTALGREDPVSFIVHHEPHFDRDEIRRHCSVLVLTSSRLIVGHTDEYASDESHPLPYATTSTEAVPLDRVLSVVMSRTVTSPASYNSGDPVREVVLTVGWGAMSRVDLEPASCADPECEADHGYTGSLTSDDFSLRISEAADGGRLVEDLLDFARTLSAATVRTPRVPVRVQ
jgi:Family of unknown function (DUF5998)